MSYPAYDQFGKDIGRGYAAWRVYMALQPPRLVFHQSRSVKAIALADELHMGRRHVIRALDWLVAHGYLIDNGRSSRGVRSLLLAHDIESRRIA